MIRYVMDSDILSLYQNGHPHVVARANAVPAAEAGTTVISVEEVLSGWYTMIRKSKDKVDLARAYQRLTSSVQFLSRLTIVTYTEAAIDRFHQLKSLKLGVKANDLRIAAIALEHHLILITRNLRDFRLITGLPLEDWSQVVARP